MKFATPANILFAIQEKGENPKNLEDIKERAIMIMRVYLSYCIIFQYSLSGRKYPKNLEPSKGGIGIRLYAISIKLRNAIYSKSIMVELIIAYSVELCTTVR